MTEIGAGEMFAVTNYPSSSPTGSIRLKGTYSTASLGGTPSAIQAQLSLTAGGPAIAGFSWANLSSPSIGGGNWSGSIASVPPGLYWVSVRAANGAAYATMRNFVSVGMVVDTQGEGNPGAYFSAGTGGDNNTIITGIDSVMWASGFGSPNVYGPFLGPFGAANKFRLAFSREIPANRLTQQASGLPLAEGPTNFDQAFWNGAGVGVGQIDVVYPGIGSVVALLGNQPQSQTIGIGNGSNATFCSLAIYCSVSAAGIGSSGSGPLAYNAAGLTGATITGYVTTAAGVSTLHVSTLAAGALEPGLVLSGAGVAGSPTLTACTASCVYSFEAGPGTTWTLSTNQGTIGSSGSPAPFNAAPSGGAPWPNSYVQAAGYPMAQNGAYGSPVVKFGSFSLSVNGTVVCTDSSTFSYTAQSGRCSGAGIASSFINYGTGDYDIAFSSPPASGAIIQASWTNIVSRNATTANEQIDMVGDGTPTSGGWSSAFNKFEGGASAHAYAGCVQDYSQLVPTTSYALAAIGLSQQISWFYDTKIPAIMPGQQAGVPLLAFGMWRYQGPLANAAGPQVLNGYYFCDQWFRDVSSPSTFTGTVTGGGTGSPVLTLDSAVAGSLWEGEVLGCNPFSTACAGTGGSTPLITLGTQIAGLLSGTWGASGSTYSLTAPGGAANVVNVSSQPMINQVYYSGGPAYYIGPVNDIVVQSSGASGIGGTDGHPWYGFTGGRRIGARAGILAAAALSNNPSLASHPTLSRPKISACDAASLAAPCFDIGSTYAASASATWSGSTVTITGGLAANARPFVDGMALSCSGCNSGLYVVSVSAPPTQSTVSGAGQVGNTFTVKASGTIGGSGSGTIAGGCSGVSGTGSNCIDFSFAINTGGTYGTAASLATCGVNTLQGSAALYTPPTGACKDSGIGEFVNGGMRIGTGQTMWGAAGGFYYDGFDPIAAVFSQSAAFTCNIVAATVVQCVKGPVYASGLPSSIGEWLSGATYASYGDSTLGVGRMGSLIGYPGGQSLGFTAGSGYTNGTYALTGSSCGQATVFTAPKMDVTVSGGAIVDVYPSAATPTVSNAGVGITTTCTFALTGMGTGSGGAVTNPTNGPVQGVGGVANMTSDNNSMGVFLYDNSGESGNPLNFVFGNPSGGSISYFEPGLPVKAWGQSLGIGVSG